MEGPPGPALYGGPSPKLDGDVHAWSPEHMLLSSLGLCMLTTFEAFCARDGIALEMWNCRANGTVEPTPEGLMFTSIVLEIEMTITGNVSRVEATLEDAKQYCLVLNSLRVPVVVETEIHTPDHAEVAREADFDPAALAALDDAFAKSEAMNQSVRRPKPRPVAQLQAV